MELTSRPLIDRILLRLPWFPPLYTRAVLLIAPGRLRDWLTMDFLRRSAKALSRRDFDVHLLGFRADAEWHTAPDTPDVSVLHGTDEIKAYLKSYFEPWASFTNEPTKLLGLGRGHVAFESVLRARGSSSGVDVEQPEAYVVELRRGWVFRLREYRQGDEALEVYLRGLRIDRARSRRPVVIDALAPPAAVALAALMLPLGVAVVIGVLAGGALLADRATRHQALLWPVVGLLGTLAASVVLAL